MWLWLVIHGLMKIVSWNVNSVRARIKNVFEYINDENPDILLLQEIKTQEETFPFEEFKKIWIHFVCFWSKKL